MLEGLDETAFLSRRHPAKDGGLSGGLDQRGLVQGGGVCPAVRVWNSGLLGGAGGCHRMISGQDLHAHALGGKVAEGIGGLWPDGVGEKNQRHGAEACAIQGFNNGRPQILGNQEDPATLGGVVFDLGL